MVEDQICCCFCPLVYSDPSQVCFKLQLKYLLSTLFLSSVFAISMSPLKCLLFSCINRTSPKQKATVLSLRINCLETQGLIFGNIFTVLISNTVLKEANVRCDGFSCFISILHPKKMSVYWIKTVLKLLFSFIRPYMDLLPN